MDTVRHKIDIFDSTLRDGMQGEGVSYSVGDKLKIVRALDALGVAFIEAGNPASNPKDLEFFRLIKKERLKTSSLVAFGSTRKKGGSAERDDGLNQLLGVETEYVSIFGKASSFHVHKILCAAPAENLAMIHDSIAYLTSRGRKVIFDAEHFFDAFAQDPDYAMKSLDAAFESGAIVLCLCDTNGASDPELIAQGTLAAVKAFPSVQIGIHCHNDRGLAVACTLSAVENGAVHVQGTLLGFGERCGNANLSTIIPNLQINRGISCIPDECLDQLTPTARQVADIANFSLRGNMPYVGSSAFAHKGGMHIDAVTKAPESFEHIAPSLVGNKRKFLMSEVSGKATLLQKLQSYDPQLTKDSPITAEIMDKLKALEYRGYQFEAAEESFELVIMRALGLERKFFSLEYFKIIGEQPLIGAMHPSSAMIKVRVGGESEITAAEGNGPIHAIDLALRKALSKFYPQLADVRLTDYKVRVLESDATTAASVRVLIESSDGISTWTTVGVSTDIIEASFLALTDSIEYKLSKDERLLRRRLENNDTELGKE